MSLGFEGRKNRNCHWRFFGEGPARMKNGETLSRRSFPLRRTSCFFTSKGEFSMESIPAKCESHRQANDPWRGVGGRGSASSASAPPSSPFSRLDVFQRLLVELAYLGGAGPMAQSAPQFASVVYNDALKLQRRRLHLAARGQYVSHSPRGTRGGGVK